MMNRRPNLSSSSSPSLVCIEGTWNDPHPKVATVLGDPADLGVEKINHASHPHPLYQFKLEIQDQTNCSICSLPIDGFAHGCEACDFFIHDEDCLKMKVQIHHISHHPAHPLHLHPPSSDRNMCDACLSPANTPFYRCSICDYDLHVDCALITEWQSQHLYFSFPAGASVWCSKCNGGISRRGGWVWYDKETGFTAHFNCGRPVIRKIQPYFLRPLMRFLLRNTFWK